MLTLFHDFTSPASAVSVARLQRLAAEGIDVTFHGFEAIGIDLTVPVTSDVVAELGAVERDAAAEGLTLVPPAALPPTGLAHVVTGVAEADNRGAAWRTAVYRAFWREGADLADREVLVRIAAGAGVDIERARAALDDRTALAAVRRRTAELRGEGVGGVPTLLAHRTLIPGLLPESDLRAMIIG